MAGSGTPTPLASTKGEESAGRSPERRKRGRPSGGPSAGRDYQLYKDWKAAHQARRITKAEFLRERGLPERDLAAIERGRAQEKRQRSGQNELDESGQALLH
jgi:hypothetical protein